MDEKHVLKEIEQVLIASSNAIERPHFLGVTAVIKQRIENGEPIVTPEEIKMAEIKLRWWRWFMKYQTALGVLKTHGQELKHDAAMQPDESQELLGAAVECEDAAMALARARYGITRHDLAAIEYAIDILEDQIHGGSELESTETNHRRLQSLLAKLSGR